MLDRWPSAPMVASAEQAPSPSFAQPVHSGTEPAGCMMAEVACSGFENWLRARRVLPVPLFRVAVALAGAWHIALMSLPFSDMVGRCCTAVAVRQHPHEDVGCGVGTAAWVCVGVQYAAPLSVVVPAVWQSVFLYVACCYSGSKHVVEQK